MRLSSLRKRNSALRLCCVCVHVCECLYLCVCVSVLWVFVWLKDFCSKLCVCGVVCVCDCIMYLCEIWIVCVSVCVFVCVSKISTKACCTLITLSLPFSFVLPIPFFPLSYFFPFLTMCLHRPVHILSFWFLMSPSSLIFHNYNCCFLSPRAHVVIQYQFISL